MQTENKYEQNKSAILNELKMFWEVGVEKSKEDQNAWDSLATKFAKRNSAAMRVASLAAGVLIPENRSMISKMTKEELQEFGQRIVQGSEAALELCIIREDINNIAK
jgi:hypothetical protein